MPVKNWDDLKLVLALSRYGTMSAAAKSLDLSTATVSRRLEKCAEEVGQTLFVRRGQVWEATPAAMVFVELAEAVTEGIPHEQSKAIDGVIEDRVLRASMPLDMCMDTLTPHMPGFLAENPGLTLDAYHESKSIAFGEVDLRLSYEEPTEGRLVRMRLGSIGFRTYTSTRFSHEPEGWVEILDAERKQSPLSTKLKDRFGAPRLRSTSVICAITLAHKMPLAVLLPTRLASEHPELAPWEPDTEIKYIPVWAAYHESRRLDADVRLALAFMKGCFAA